MLPSQEMLGQYAGDVVTLLDNARVDSSPFSAIRSELASAEVIVPVVGGFSAGKSSLLNALLGRDVLPVGLTPETELATELRYGSDEHLLAWRKDGSTERHELAAMKDIKARAAEFTHLQAYLDNAFLSGCPELVLVDMPGFGSSFANHDKAVAYYLPRGAHFIAVISVEDGNLTQSMTRQLGEIHALGRSLTFVLSKTNLRGSADVDAVMSLLEEQIATAFDMSGEIHRAGLDSGASMRSLVEAMDADEIMTNAFVPMLKEETLVAIGHLNAAEAALRRSDKENRKRREELLSSLEDIEQSRDNIISDIRASRVGHAVDACMREVTRELDLAQNELLQAATSGNTDAFNMTFTQITRGVVGRVMQGEMRQASQRIATAVADAITPTRAAEAGPTGLGKELLTTVKGTLETAGGALNTWSSSIAGRNAAEVKRLKDETKWKPGEKVPRATYQGLATVLAVTTNVVNPVIELAIIFLPTLLDWVNESRSREKMRERIAGEIIPNYLRRLRDELPTILDDQMALLVDDVSSRYEAEIQAQRSAAEEAIAAEAAGGQEVAGRIGALSEARNAIQQLANRVLFNEVTA